MFERRRLGRGLLALVLTATVLAVVPGTPAAAAPCEKQWTNPGTDGVWDVDGASNATETQWTPTGVPTASDTVCLAPGDYDVYLSSAAGSTYTIESLDVGTPSSSGPRLWIGGPFDVADDVDLTVTGATTIEGDVLLADESVLFANGGVNQNGGNLELDGVIHTSTYVLNDGVLTGNEGNLAEGRINGNLVNLGGIVDAGSLPVGSSAGFLYINGDYVQGAGGTLWIDYENTALPPTGGEGVGYDHVHVVEPAQLGGLAVTDVEVVPGLTLNTVLFAQKGVEGQFSTVAGMPSEWLVYQELLPTDIVELKIIPGDLFDDVPSFHPFLLDIGYLVGSEITGGFPDDTFRPTNTVTRQSTAAFLYRLMDEPASTPPSPPSFSDVGTSHPFRTEIEWLAEEEITGGFPDGTFRPTGAVTRGSMAAFLYRLAGEPAFTPPSPPTFDDVGTGHTFRTEIEWLASTGVTTGFSDDTFRPAVPVSRQSMAAFLRRIDRAGLVPD
jgi:hypothetical protein